MPVRMLNFLTQPPPVKNGQHGGVIQKSPEWQDMVLALGAGLKPHEYITVEFPPESPVNRICKDPIGNLIVQAKTKVKELQLPYDVYRRGNICYIVGRGLNGE